MDRCNHAVSVTPRSGSPLLLRLVTFPSSHPGVPRVAGSPKSALARSSDAWGAPGPVQRGVVSPVLSCRRGGPVRYRSEVWTLACAGHGGHWRVLQDKRSGQTERASRPQSQLTHTPGVVGYICSRAGMFVRVLLFIWKHSECQLCAPRCKRRSRV